MNIGSLIRFRPPRIAMSFVLVATAAHFMLELPLHTALRTTAAVLGLAGFALMIRAWWLFNRANTAICPTATSTSLITHDVFSISRNPMYLGMILMLTAPALATGSAPFYIGVTGFTLVMDRVFCPYEEQKAVTEFGDRYDAYRRSARRWF